MVAPRPPRSLLHLTLAGLSELKLFRTPEAREHAISSYAKTLGGSEGLKGLAGGILIIAATVAGVVFAVRVIVSHFTQAMWVRDAGFAVAITGGFVLMRWLHQRGAASHMRRHLIDSGVPVCIDCGYSLDGLPADSITCPECGADLTEPARHLLHIVGTVRRDAAQPLGTRATPLSVEARSNSPTAGN